MRDGSNAREKAQDEYKRATREASEKYRKIDSDIERQINSLYSQLKEVLNAKEEKDNDDSSYVRAIKKAERIIDRLLQTREETDARNFLRKMGWSMSTLGDRFDIARSIRRAVRTDPDKADSVLNNEKEEKDNASVQDRFRHKGCMITILKKGENQYTFTIEQDGREEGTKSIYPTQDKAESEAKREVEANWNEKEEGYYAKLAEEKADKKNAKSWRVEFLGNSHYIETIADAESAQSKAQRDLAIKERQLSQQGEEIRQEYWEFSQQIRKIEKEIESQKKK